VNVALPAFAAERRATVARTVSSCFSAVATGRTDGRTSYRYIDPVPHTMRAGSASYSVSLDLSAYSVFLFDRSADINKSLPLFTIATARSGICYMGY